MGSILLIGSCEPFSGKSALVLGLARQLATSGHSVRFGKPLATSLEWPAEGEGLPDPLIDDDVRFIGSTLGLTEEQLIPSLQLLAPGTADQRLAEGRLDPGDEFKLLQQQLQQNNDSITLLEAAGSLHEGLLYGLSLGQLANGLDAKVVLVGDHAEALKLLVDRKIDAMAGDQATLFGIGFKTQGDDDLVITEDLLSFEPYALPLRRNDADFRLVVNRSLSELYIRGDVGRSWEKWFGSHGVRPTRLLLMLYRLNSFSE